MRSVTEKPRLLSYPSILNTTHEGGLDQAIDGDFLDPAHSFSLAVYRPGVIETPTSSSQSNTS